MYKNDLLLIGGNKDFNITRMSYVLRENNVPSEIIRYQIGNPLDITFDINNLELRINGKVSTHKAIFFRCDMFEAANNGNDKKLIHDSTAIFETLRQYLMLREDIKVFGRSGMGSRGTKIVNLHKARQVGFKIPKTLISSNIIDIKKFTHDKVCIQKPIDGGEYTVLCDNKKINSCRDDFSRPYLIQECLKQPEIRIYCVGDKIFPFQVIYEGIDYRQYDGNKIKVVPTEISQDIADKYKVLTNMLGFEYSAGDFMTNEEGELVFLEINNCPMFARVDEEMNGEICKAMIDFLLS